jgi:hypothetical protein
LSRLFLHRRGQDLSPVAFELEWVRLSENIKQFDHNFGQLWIRKADPFKKSSSFTAWMI